MTRRRRDSAMLAKSSMRNLGQYKGMTDEQFNEAYSQVTLGLSRDLATKEKFNRIMAQFEEEYDLEDMLPNDRIVLQDLINTMIQLEGYELVLIGMLREEEVNIDNITVTEKLNNICSRLRNDISSMQNDLKITKKIRQSDREQSVINYLEDLKVKAKTFYKEKMHYIVCEKCGNLLATVWWQNPEARSNTITIHCMRKGEDGHVCGWERIISAKEMTENGGSNKPEVLPESMR